MSLLEKWKLLLLLPFLFFAGMQEIKADSPNAPLMNEEQIISCQQGNMEVLSSYLGSGNMVVMACVYKAEWEPPSSKNGKGKLTSYATVVRSPHRDFPVGAKIRWINYMEEVSHIPKETLDQWQSLAGKLIYIINPWRKLQKEEGDIATAQDGTEEISYSFNFPIADHTYYNNLRAVLDIPVKTASSPPRVATQAEIDNDHDNFLRGTARKLRQNDVVLAVIIYKYVSTDQGTTFYARVIQSLRGDIPVEALVKWTSPYQKLPAGSPPVTKTTLSCYLTYVLSESKNVKELGEDPEDFKPASTVYSSQVLLGAYDLGNHVDYFPMTESDPGRAMKKLLHIEPAKITAESEAARFKPESGK